MKGDEGKSHRPRPNQQDPDSTDTIDPTSLAELTRIGDADQVKRARRRRFDLQGREHSLPFAIGVAGFFYPIVLSLLLAVVGVVTELPLADVGILQVLVGLVGMIVGAPLGGFFVAIFAYAVAWIVLLVVGMLVKSFGVEPDGVRIGAHVGAWTAFVGTTLVMAWMRFFHHPDPLMLIAGPGLATPLAQYAGAWSQWGDGPRRVQPGWPRFAIGQILVATAWLALLLTLLKVMGWPNVWAFGYVGGWLVYQWVTLRLVLRFCERRYDRVLEGGRGDVWGTGS